MAERVRADAFGQSHGLGQFFDDMEDHDPAEVFPPSEAEEYIIFFSRFDVDVVPVVEIEGQFTDGPWGDRHQPLLVAFSGYFDESFIQVKVGQFQVAEFADPQSTTV